MTDRPPHDLDDGALEALAAAHARRPPEVLRERVLAEVRVAKVGRSLLRARQLALVATAAAVTLGGYLIFGQASAVSPRLADGADRQALLVQRAELSRELARQQRELGLLEDLLTVHSNVVRILTSRDFRQAMLTPPDGSRGVARVLMDRASGEIAILGRGLPPPDAGRVYELWAIRDDGTHEPAGSLIPEGRGYQVRMRSVPAPGEVQQFAISLEPTDGAERPTGPIVLAGEVE